MRPGHAQPLSSNSPERSLLLGIRCQCNCVHLTTDNTTGISRCCVNGSMRSSSICLMVVCFCSRCRRWLVLFYISSSDSVPDTLVEVEAIRYRLLEGGGPVGSAPGEQFLRDVIRGKKGAQPQQLGGCRVGLLDLLKRELPGGGDRGRVPRGLPATAREQRVPMRLVELEIVSQAASRFFDVGPGLIEGQGKLPQRYDQVGRLVDLFIRGTGEPLPAAQQEFGPPHYPPPFP